MNDMNDRAFILFILGVMGIIVVPVSMALGLIIAPLVRMIRLPLWIVFVLGLLLWLVAWLMGISLNTMYQLNQLFWQQILDGAPFPWIDMATIVSTLPMTLALSSVLAFLMHHQNAIQAKIANVGLGKHQEDKPLLSDRIIQKALHNIKSSAHVEGSMLGVNQMTGNPVLFKDIDANAHSFVLGTTGSGKTNTLANIVESLIEREMPLIFVDGKGDLDFAYRVKRRAEQQGVSVYLFTMVGNRGCGYHPLASGGITSKKDRIIELRTWSEDHYRKISEGYLQTVFAILERCHIKPDLCQLSTLMRADNVADLVRDHDLFDEFEHKIKSLKERERDVSSLIAEVENMVDSELGHLFDTTAFATEEVLILSKAIEENAVIYFCLQPLAFPAYAECLGKLIVNDIKAYAATQLQQENPKKVYVFLDEFSLFAGDQVINLINQGRGAGIHALLATQSLSDLIKNGSDALVGQVVSNCNNFIIHRQNFHDDAEQLAALIGTNDKAQITAQVNSQNEGNHTGSVRLGKEFIIHPDTIKRLKMGEAIVLNKQNFMVTWLKARLSLI